MKASGGKAYFPALTGIRAVAAFLVYFHHFNPFAQSTGRVAYWAARCVAEFHVGVTLFFVLSGFLISIRYADSVRLSRAWLLPYARNRIARIYPMYFLLTTLTFGVLAFVEPDQTAPAGSRWTLYLSNITFLRGFFDDLKFTGISQGWSLTVEECFYFSVPLLIILSRRGIPLYVMAAGLILMGLGLVRLVGPWSWYGFLGTDHFVLLYTFFGRCTEFFIGMALAIRYQKSLQESRSVTRGWAVYAGIAGIAGLVAAMAVLETPGLIGLRNPISIALNNWVLPLAVAVLYWGLLTEQSMVRRWLETPLMDLLGKSSYTFYLIHMSVIQAALFKYLSRDIWVLFVILNLLAIGLYQWVEEPLHRLVRNYAGLSRTKKPILAEKV